SRRIIQIIDYYINLAGTEDITKGGPPATTWKQQPSSAPFRDVLKAAVSDVTVQNLLAFFLFRLRAFPTEARRINPTCGNVNIGPAIVVIVGNARGKTISRLAIRNSRGLGYISEGPVAIVVIENVLGTL